MRIIIFAFSWLALIAAPAEAQIANYVSPKNVPTIVPSYGLPADGLGLGLSLIKEASDDPSSIVAFITLRNTGTQSVFISQGSPRSFTLAGSSQSGKKALLIDSPIPRIFIRNNFLLGGQSTLDPGASATLRVDLSPYLLVPEAGRYQFLVSAKMDISTLIPPRRETIQEIELISGPAGFDVPVSMVYTNTGKHPSSATKMDVPIAIGDPSAGRTPRERDMIRRANEARTNEFRKHWPWLLGEAPFPTNATNGALSPAVPPALAVAPSLDDGRKRWWLAGIAAGCAAGIGFLILRRRRSRPQG